MTLRNTCFISYRNPGHAAAARTLQAFHDALEGRLALYVPKRGSLGGAVTGGVFIDRQRLQPGDVLDPNLAQELCCSACMIVLYTPAYFDPDALYCAREYRAMLDLEARRGRLLVDELAGKSLIIPVVIRGSDELPAILSNRVFASFERDLLRASDFGKRDLTQRVEDIAKQVYLRYRALKAQPIDCEGFALPDDSGTSAWLKSNVTTRGRPMPGTGGG